MTVKRGRENKGKLVQAHPSDDSSSELKKPAFSLEYLSKGSDFSLDSCSKDQLAQFAKKLNMLSQMTWREIRYAPRHGLGMEKIPQSAIKATIPPHIIQDTIFWALRCFNKGAPMVGYKEGRIFLILWLDRNSRLYEH